MCERSLSEEPGVKRVIFISNPDETGVKRVVSIDANIASRTIVGQTDGTRGEWSIPNEMWNQEDLERLVGDLEAAQDS